MAQARAYLMSFVGLQLAMARDKFPERFPHPWLVWEPGAWHVSQGVAHRTMIPTEKQNMPGKGDALCFELAMAPGQVLHAGRMDAHALVINDATFSRDQLILGRPTPDQWTVQAIPGSQPSTLDGLALGTFPRSMQSGSRIQAGNVTLRFYQPFDFAARLDEEIRAGRI